MSSGCSAFISFSKKNSHGSLLSILFIFFLQFAVVQYASGSTIHFDFTSFNVHYWRNQVDQINQMGGGTYTAAGIQRVV